MRCTYGNEDQKFAHSIAEFAQLSGFGRSFLYEQITSGRLPVRKAGRRTLILHDEGLAWLAKLPIAGQRAPPFNLMKRKSRASRWNAMPGHRSAFNATL